MVYEAKLMEENSSLQEGNHKVQFYPDSLPQTMSQSPNKTMLETP